MSKVISSIKTIVKPVKKEKLEVPLKQIALSMVL
jgi:hypothetical protein